MVINDKEINLKPWDWKNLETSELDYWQTAAKEVYEFAHELKRHKLRSIYDLGCGLGRNLFYLIDQGFELYGSDFSQHAVDEVNKGLRAIGYPHRVTCESMTRLNAMDASFDAVIAFHVICHGYKEDTHQAVREIKRIVKPGGRVLLTFLSRNSVKGEFRSPQVEEWTVIKEDGVEKGIPHHFSDRDEILSFMDGFTIYELSHVEHEYDNLQKSSSHYFVKAIRI